MGSRHGDAESRCDTFGYMTWGNLSHGGSLIGWVKCSCTGGSRKEWIWKQLDFQLSWLSLSTWSEPGEGYLLTSFLGSQERNELKRFWVESGQYYDAAICPTLMEPNNFYSLFSDEFDLESLRANDNNVEPIFTPRIHLNQEYIIGSVAPALLHAGTETPDDVSVSCI